MKSRALDAAILGGGPAGLRAATVLADAGMRVAIFDRMPSLGRKFLVAGRGGLNLTHSEPVANFPARYRDEPARWRSLLAEFGPADTRAWAESVGIETYVGTSGRVFPRGQQAAKLLRGWIAHLRARGAEIHVRREWKSLKHHDDGTWRIGFAHCPDAIARAIILALGGASWPETGSDGRWTSILAGHGVSFRGWQPANCGWEVVWDSQLLAAVEGLPLKNIEVSAGGKRVAGELLITRYGLEGGAIYQLGPELRRRPLLTIDLKPAKTREQLARIKPGAWKLSSAGRALLEFGLRAAPRADPATLAKALPVQLHGPRPIAEAISSAGGVPWSELNDDLMFRKLPGVFAAGESIDWEAPTGGYLLQGCLSTGERAARGVRKWLSRAARKTVDGPGENGVPCRAG